MKRSTTSELEYSPHDTTHTFAALARRHGVSGGERTIAILALEPPELAARNGIGFRDGFDALRSDSECRVRNQSLIGEYYVDCEVGTAKDKLPEGGTVPVERTSSSIPPDLIASVMRRF